MKQWLLGSRALDHQPQYAARHGRVATARSLNFPILWTSADVIPHLLIDFLGGISWEENKHFLQIHFVNF